jgi:hypothetical protein
MPALCSSPSYGNACPLCFHPPQFFLISPLFLFLYKRRPLYGVIAMLTALCGSVLSVLVLSVSGDVYTLPDTSQSLNWGLSSRIYYRYAFTPTRMLLCFCAGTVLLQLIEELVQ